MSDLRLDVALALLEERAGRKLSAEERKIFGLNLAIWCFRENKLYRNCSCPLGTGLQPPHYRLTHLYEFIHEGTWPTWPDWPD